MTVIESMRGIVKGRPQRELKRTQRSHHAFRYTYNAITGLYWHGMSISILNK